MKATQVTEGLTQLEEAQRIVLESTPILGLEKISILDALGRILGEDIVADRDNPPWDNSAMDGFAVRWEDIKQEHAIQKTVTLTVIEEVAAGKMPLKSVGAGQAIRIMTGAPLPKGADTVLMLKTLSIHLIPFASLSWNNKAPTFGLKAKTSKEASASLRREPRFGLVKRGCWRSLPSRSSLPISGPGWRSSRPVMNWRIWMSGSAKIKSSTPIAMGLQLLCKKQAAFPCCWGLRRILQLP